MHGDPDATLPYLLIVMPIDASRAGNVGSWNFGMPLLDRGGQTPRRFGDNLKRSRHRVEDKRVAAEPFIIEAVNEVLGENDVFADMKKIRPRIGRLRRHIGRRFPREVEYKASGPHDRPHQPARRTGWRYSASGRHSRTLTGRPRGQYQS